MKFDDAIEKVGGFGGFQIYAYLLMGMFGFWTYHGVAAPFVLMEVDHWCMVNELTNFSHQEQRYIGIPYNEDGENETCKRISVDFSKYSEAELKSWNRSERSDVLDDTTDCATWVYDRSFYRSSAVISFDLVCGRQWLVSFASTLYLLGALVGAFTCGLLSDKFGRMTAAMLTNALTIAGGVLCACAPNYPLFAVGRFLASMGRIAVSAIAMVYIMEVVGKQFRAFFGLSFGLLSGFGYCIMPWVAKALKSDFYFQLALTLPTVLYFSFWWLLPESPRWLLVHRKYEKADKALRMMAKFNKIPLEEDFDVTKIEIESQEKGVKKKSIIDIFRGPILRKRILVVFFLWFTVVLQYFAVSLNVASLPGDVYMTTFYIAMMEIPGQLSAIFICNWKMMGRKRTLIMCVIAQGLCGFISLPLLRNDLEYGLLAVILIGRLFLTTAFGIIYFYTPELFPTEVRNTVLGGSSTIGRISGMIAAFVGGPLEDVWWGLPNVIYGVMGTTAGLLCILLPETLGEKMCETIDEAEHRIKGEEESDDAKVQQKGTKLKKDPHIENSYDSPALETQEKSRL